MTKIALDKGLDLNFDYLVKVMSAKFSIVQLPFFPFHTSCFRRESLSAAHTQGSSISVREEDLHIQHGILQDLSLLPHLFIQLFRYISVDCAYLFYT